MKVNKGPNPYSSLLKSPTVVRKFACTLSLPWLELGTSLFVKS